MPHISASKCCDCWPGVSCTRSTPVGFRRMQAPCKVSLLSASHLLTPCLSWLFFQSQFCPNALGSLPSTSISSKFTVPVPLSSLPHCIPVLVPSPPGPCPRPPPPVFLGEVFALPWIQTQPIALAYKMRNQNVLFWGAYFENFSWVIEQAQAAAAVSQLALHEIAFPLSSKVHMGDIL